MVTVNTSLTQICVSRLNNLYGSSEKREYPSLIVKARQSNSRLNRGDAHSERGPMPVVIVRGGPCGCHSERGPMPIVIVRGGPCGCHSERGPMPYVCIFSVIRTLIWVQAVRISGPPY